MGKEKALIEFKGRPLLLWMVDILSDSVEELAVSVADGKKKEYLERLAEFGNSNLLVLEDKYRFFGPLGGMRSSIPHLQGELVAVAPCDSPFISKDLYPLLFDEVGNLDGAVPKVRGHYEPLHAVYRREAMTRAMELTLEKGELKPIDTYRHLRIAEIAESSITRFDPKLRSFENINTIDELKSLEEL
jgi:molybdopterin-guanine dinucleotide biosynthesis protein A